MNKVKYANPFRQSKSQFVWISILLGLHNVIIFEFFFLDLSIHPANICHCVATLFSLIVRKP